MSSNPSAPAAADRRPRFQRWYGIDYSGAGTPGQRLPGLRWFAAGERTGSDRIPVEVRPADGRHWSRRALAEALAERLEEGVPTLVGIDHAFSLPLAYFERHGLEPDWDAMLDDFCENWPTDRHVVEEIRRGRVGSGRRRGGEARWRRVTDVLAGAKSPFHFDVPGSVAKSTHAGLPWLRWLRHRLAGGVHVWPFDGWRVPPEMSALVEIYPALWSGRWPRSERHSQDQHDAWATARWLAEADRTGDLEFHLAAPRDGAIPGSCRIEGWILGLPTPVLGAIGKIPPKDGKKELSPRARSR